MDGADEETVITGVWVTHSSRSPYGKVIERQEDREAAAIIVLDGGSLILSDAALAAPELALGEG